eukprot:TRINITY_DN1574_c0_g4_i1.p1 TRINITY_DN1574_c0_g4~~TRINITY_DN1574_c0_g4_i1.p1  ORF type:complete len:179 (-),score=24.51 TRINITY_DN1574_c0_g4_i1:53-589(-)
MCRQCVLEEFPARGTTCLEAGSFLVNFKGCTQCGHRQLISNSEKDVQEDEESETITFQHTCSSCSHVICEHYHSFSVDTNQKSQEYLMECLLCGKGCMTSSFAAVRILETFDNCASAVSNPDSKENSPEEEERENPRPKRVDIQLVSTFQSLMQNFERDPKFQAMMQETKEDEDQEWD